MILTGWPPQQIIVMVTLDKHSEAVTLAMRRSVHRQCDVDIEAFRHLACIRRRIPYIAQIVLLNLLF